ncbi:hypothetical protein HOLleu_20038 [Holothuria leucospilota]|uniref:Uncharacterized protein n=1 Tax=Holothuria leucospilota TaxID=206669 RepID=A0A9Q1C083_HOLLE|nr:hypothetical protein HOLleu_20038 [Holothuria leucospilota]
MDAETLMATLKELSTKVEAMTLSLDTEKVNRTQTSPAVDYGSIASMSAPAGYQSDFNRMGSPCTPCHPHKHQVNHLNVRNESRATHSGDNSAVTRALPRTMGTRQQLPSRCTWGISVQLAT